MALIFDRDTSNAPRQVTNGDGLIALAQGGVIFENQPGGLGAYLIYLKNPVLKSLHTRGPSCVRV